MVRPGPDETRWDEHKAASVAGYIADVKMGGIETVKRWIVERTIAWFNRCRRLAKDLENLTRNALAFLKLASIRLMLRKLCNSS
jgi:hypothetical protein